MVLNGIFVLKTNVSRWWSMGVVLYWRISFEITQGTKVPRISWVKCISGCIQRGVVSGFDCTFLI